MVHCANQLDAGIQEKTRWWNQFVCPHSCRTDKQSVRFWWDVVLFITSLNHPETLLLLNIRPPFIAASGRMSLPESCWAGGGGGGSVQVDSVITGNLLACLLRPLFHWLSWQWVGSVCRSRTLTRSCCSSGQSCDEFTGPLQCQLVSLRCVHRWIRPVWAFPLSTVTAPLACSLLMLLHLPLCGYQQLLYLQTN